MDAPDQVAEAEQERVLVPQPAPLAIAAGPDPASLSPASLLALQRGAGNAAVTRMLARAPDPKATPPQPGSEEAKALGAGLQKRADAVSARARSGVANIGKAQTSSLRKLRGEVRPDLDAVADVYAVAYKSFEDVLGKGKARAAQWDGLVINVVIGVGVGLVAGWVVPLGLTAKAAATFGAKVLEGVIAEHASWAGAEKAQEAIKPPEPPMPPHPLSKRVDALQKIEQADASLLDLGGHLEFMAGLLGAGAAAGYDCQALALTGRHKTPVDKLEEGVTGLENSAAELGKVEQAIATVLKQVEQLAAEAAKAKKEAYPKRMERHIWVHWMGTMSEDAWSEKNPDEHVFFKRNELERIASIVDSDPIERRLEDLGLLAENAYEGPSDLGWYVGKNHTQDESLDGANRARRLSKALEHVGKRGALQQNPWRPDPYAKGTSLTSGVILAAGAKGGNELLPVQLMPRATLGEQVVIHSVKADQGDPLLYARGVNVVETREEERSRDVTRQPY